MGVSKVIINGTTKVDLTSDTVASNNLLSGYTAHGADGNAVSGSAIAGVDMPTFTLTYSNDWETFISITCDKTYNECVSYWGNGQSNASLTYKTQLETYENSAFVHTFRIGDNYIAYTASFSGALPGFDIQYASNGTITMVEPSSLLKTLNITQNGTYTETFNFINEIDVSVPTGTARTSSDLTASGATVTVPAGLYSVNATKTIASGTATTPATSITANPSISVSNSGLITATTSATKSVTPTVSAGYVSSGTAGTITVSGSNTSQLPTKSSSDLTVSGATVTAPAGYYSSSASKSVASGTAGTPTATKGTVSNHSVSVTPSVTNTTGYITGSTINGTAVTVSASELVSGTLPITTNGTGIDVTNYAAVDVNAAPTYTCTILNNGDNLNKFIYNSTGYYTANTTVTFSAGDTASLTASNSYKGEIWIDGIKVAYSDNNRVSYSYTLPAHDIEIMFNTSAGKTEVTFPTLSISTNGKTNVSDYYYADVDIPTGTARTSSDLTASGATVTVPAGLYSENATKTIASGSATTPATTVTANPSISVSSGGLITATASTTKSVTPTVSAGYVSSGTAGTITVSGSNTSQLSTEAGKTVTPTESVQTAVAAGKYTTGDIKVGAISSTYVGSGISSRSSSDLTVSGATVTVPAGYYSTQATKSVASGTAGTPTATKGTVSNHSVTVTPSVTNTTGYITGSTKTGTAVTVSASELVSGTKTITSNGTGVDVKNYAAVNVNVTPTHTCTIISNTSASNCRVLCNGNQYSFNGGKSFTFNTGDEIEIEAGDSNNQSGRVFVDGVKVADGDMDSVRYSYTAPDHDIEISATIRDETEGRVDVAFPTVSINTNGKHDVSDYYYADVDIPTGTARSAEDITVSGGNATIPAGLYSSAVTLSAAQLVSGTKTISSNATGINVANYQYVDVTVPEPALVVTRTSNAAGGTTVSIDTTQLKAIDPLTVTLNGTYTPPAGHVYSPVVVDVPGGYIPDTKQVQFIDYDGTVLYEYTEDEINELSVLPANPSHQGLVAQGWNWTLEEITDYLDEMPGMQITVGQSYVTSSGDTEIDIVLDSDTLNPYFQVAINGSAVVDWGDGSTADTIIGTSTTETVSQGHVYGLPGEYTISITVSGTMCFLSDSQSYTSFLTNNSVRDLTYCYAVKAIRLGNNVEIDSYAFTKNSQLEYVSCPTNTVIKTTSNGTGASNVFYGCLSLIGFVLPHDTQNVPASFFGSCHKLKRVAIPKGVNRIGQSAFLHDINFSRIFIPSNITIISSTTFSRCTGPKSIIFSAGMSSIGSNAFTEMTNLQTISVPSLGYIGPYAFQGCIRLESFAIPDGVSSIMSATFMSCFNLSSVTLPSTIKSIGTSAFTFCSKLNGIVLPGGLSTLSANAFQYCSMLKSISIPQNVTRIEQQTFHACWNLSNITLPSNLSYIGTSAFAACYALRSITIPSTLSTIGSSAFAMCRTLRSISVPDSVNSIYQSAFYSCQNLKTVTLPSSVSTFGAGLFAACYSLESVSMPNNLSIIPASLFDYCSALRSITIPSGVASIYSYAFRGCINISEYHVLPTTPPVLSGSNVFTSIASDCVIYVPSTALDTYKAATHWSFFSSMMQGE